MLNVKEELKYQRSGYKMEMEKKFFDPDVFIRHMHQMIKRNFASPSLDNIEKIKSTTELLQLYKEYLPSIIEKYFVAIGDLPNKSIEYEVSLYEIEEVLEEFEEDVRMTIAKIEVILNRKLRTHQYLNLERIFRDD